MAYLSSPNSKYQLYLKTFHQFGRLASAVDTLIDSPNISRIHAIIEWIDSAWYIRDLSKNGVLLNDKKIQANKLYQLTISDRLCFAKQQHISFVVENLDEPKDALIPYDEIGRSNDTPTTPIILEQYHFLPSELAPEIIVFYDLNEKSWFCENVADTSVSKVSDGELLKFSHSMWQLIKGADISEKETLVIDEKSEQDLIFIFNISQDEELTELIIKNNTDEISCDTRSHHYLTALLARYRSQDCQSSLPEYLQGWRTIEQLTKDIGLSESHVNIQIHRARKQLADKLHSLGLYGSLLIERKKGQVRFSANHYQIYKGQILEQDSINKSIEFSA
jgi:hypothetical protein